MEVASQVQLTTPASKLYQRDIQGDKLPPEFPPEVSDEAYPGKGLPSAARSAGLGQSVDISV